MVKPKIVLLIFVSGKIVLTGAKVCLPSTLYSLSVMSASRLDIAFSIGLVFNVSTTLYSFQVREEIYQAFQAIYPVLTEFRKP